MEGYHEENSFVTSGAGFIGLNFVYLLLEERTEWKVVCVDVLTYTANIHTLNDELKNPNFVFYNEKESSQSLRKSIPMLW